MLGIQIPTHVLWRPQVGFVPGLDFYEEIIFHVFIL